MKNDLTRKANINLIFWFYLKSGFISLFNNRIVLTNYSVIKCIEIIDKTRRKSTGFSGCSAVRLAHLLWEQGVVGSNPATPTTKRQSSKMVAFLCVFITFFSGWQKIIVLPSMSIQCDISLVTSLVADLVTPELKALLQIGLAYLTLRVVMLHQTNLLEL